MSFAEADCFVAARIRAGRPASLSAFCRGGVLWRVDLASEGVELEFNE